MRSDETTNDRTTAGLGWITDPATMTADERRDYIDRYPCVEVLFTCAKSHGGCSISPSETSPLDIRSSSLALRSTSSTDQGRQECRLGNRHPSDIHGLSAVPGDAVSAPRMLDGDCA